jgi:hypothetical protein
MSSLENLTGRWIGHYDQRGKEYPVSADLVQDGVNLAGSMRDGQPDRDCSLFEATVEAGLPPGADEQIDANLRAMIPDTPATAIRSLSHLPPDSQLAGRCEGRVVTFVKHYIGQTFSGFKVGDKIVGMEAERLGATDTSHSGASRRQSDRIRTRSKRRPVPIGTAPGGSSGKDRVPIKKGRRCVSKPSGDLETTDYAIQRMSRMVRRGRFGYAVSWTSASGSCAPHSLSESVTD